MVGEDVGTRALWVRESGLVVGVGENGAIVRSTDFGQTWARIHSPTRYDLVAVAGRDGVLLAVGRDGSIARSDNEGRTWWLVRQEGPALRSVAVGPEGRALVCGADGRVLLSTDAGTSWVSERLDVALDFAAAGVDRTGTFHLLAREGLLVSFGAERRWYARAVPLLRPRALFVRGLVLVVVDERGRAAVSRDAGETWAAHAASGVGPLVGCWMDRTGEVFAVGDQTLARSTSGPWSKVPVEGEFLAVAGDNQGHVYAAGRRGLLYRSIDGGDTWYDGRLVARTEYDASWTVARRGVGTAIWATPGGRILVGGPDGRISVSDDQGVLWLPTETDTTGWVHDLWGPDDRSLHACAFGALMLSTDAGATWQTVKKSRECSISRLTGNLAGRRYALAPPDRFFTGRTTKPYWAESVVTTPGPLADVAACGGGVCVLVGAQGVVLRSVDNGASFVEVPSPTRRDLKAVHAAGRLLVAVGAGGTVLRSEDAGETWAIVTTPARETLEDVWIIDEEVYAVGDRGVVIWSIDQGASFLLEPTGGEYTFKRVCGNKKHVWVLGHDGSDSVLLRHAR